MGLLTPWSHVPHNLLSYTDNMSFWERVYNVYLSTYELIYRKYYYLPEMDKQAREFFSHLERDGHPLPSVAELEKKISAIFVNSHTALAGPRPAMPGMVNVAAAHIKPPKPLPADLQKFLDESKNGVIYFSLGSFVQSKDMPKETAAVILGKRSRQ